MMCVTSTCVHGRLFRNSASDWGVSLSFLFFFFLSPRTRFFQTLRFFPALVRDLFLAVLPGSFCPISIARLESDIVFFF